jgi:hypothetical protein
MDLRGSIRKVAAFLGIEPSQDAWTRIETYTSFEWMKQNTVKFETFPFTPVPALERGAMVRKGKIGAAHEDGMTPEIAAHVRETGARILTDPAAMKWLYEGGPLLHASPHS